MHDFSASPDHALLVLGRLDGRLCNSPAADIWLARARLKGASMLSGFAGVPVSVAELQNWICGRTPPPRHSEGLNDPLSVAARSEEHTSELQSLMRNSYAVFCLKK